MRPDHQSFTFPASFRREERGGGIGIGWDEAGIREAHPILAF